MADDPWEQTDVSDAHPEVVDRLTERKLLWAGRHREGSTDTLGRVAEHGPSGYLSFADDFAGV